MKKIESRSSESE